MLDGLIVGNMARAIADSVGKGELTELRIGVGKPLIAMRSTSRERMIVRQSGKPYIASQEDIDSIVARATDLSPYSVSDEIIRGFIPFRSARIGVCGEGVSEGGKLIGIKNISYMVIRIPHQILTAANGVIDKVLTKKSVYNDNFDIKSADSAKCDGTWDVKNTLVISPPGAGKTTLLREIARLVSSKLNVVIIDERYELALANGGKNRLDVGYCEVISGVPKRLAYESCVRALSPDVIVTDELFRCEEVDAIKDIVRSGVKVIASVHGEGADSLLRSPSYGGLLEVMELAITLAPVGKIREVRAL